MPNVLIFKETLLPPSETFILAQMRSLRRYQPTLIGLEQVQPSLPLPEESILLSSGPTPYSSLRAKLYRRVGLAPLFHGKARQTRAALIHAHFATGGKTALALARATKTPLLVTLHGADITVRPRRADQYKQLGQQADGFICVSKFIRDRALEAGLPEKKLTVLYTGIDRSEFTPTDPTTETQSVLFVGRMVEKKGCEYLLRAMQQVQKRHTTSELILIGDGPLRSSLQSLAQSLDLRCSFLGVQPPPRVRDILRQARLFCAPSIRSQDGDSEGLGMVFAEAQAMGVPVVSTLHGGIPEVVANDETGLLVPERDADSLAVAIGRLLEDQELWKRFHLAAPEHIARHFDLQTQTAILEELYDKCVSEVV